MDLGLHAGFATNGSTYHKRYTFGYKTARSPLESAKIHSAAAFLGSGFALFYLKCPLPTKR